MKLRSTELQMTEVDAPAEFLEKTWRLLPLGRFGDTVYFRGSGPHAYLLSVRRGDTAAVLSVTFSCNEMEIDSIRHRARSAGVPVHEVPVSDAPGGEPGVLLRGPENQTYRFLRTGAVSNVPHDDDTPVQITHTVLNVNDLKASEAFATEVLGFRISDRTRAMTFVRCNQKHHCVAYAPAELPSLNHIAFEMKDTDAVMRGIGRMRDYGIACAWGPGRHGPGDNVFGYFLAPFGGVIEYTAEISEVADDYQVGAPEDWKWPQGRIDQWGLGTKDVANIVAAEKFFRFPPA
jgi:2,3-dihydroxy-p-cumate/2,3-dihydroxybenzoate 3,4-dioxygenase